MKEIIRTYKFKLQPTNEQKMLLDKHLGCNRFVYNYFLNQRKEEYLKGNKLTFNQQAKYLTDLKKIEEYNWLKEINSQSLQASLTNLEVAYLRFFKGLAKFPKFKSKKNKSSFHIPQYVSIDNNLLNIPKFKNGIKFIKHREINGEVLNATISKSSTNKYFVSLVVKEQYSPFIKTNKQIGIDLGIKDQLITNEGQKFKNHKYFKQYEKELVKHQKHLSRKTYGSNRYNKQRLKVAQIHEKITNSRMDNLHKISHYLVNNYDLICIENLNVKGMIKNPKLSKSIQDISWGNLINFLDYKCKYNDKQLIQINRFYPSSKSCSSCNSINEGLQLKDRKWVCKECGEIHDRDINAAKNILKQGILTIKSEGRSDNTRGAKISLKTIKSQKHKLRNEKPKSL
jgi:putative transposase